MDKELEALLAGSGLDDFADDGEALLDMNNPLDAEFLAELSEAERAELLQLPLNPNAKSKSPSPPPQAPQAPALKPPAPQAPNRPVGNAGAPVPPLPAAPQPARPPVPPQAARVQAAQAQSQQPQVRNASLQPRQQAIQANQPHRANQPNQAEEPASAALIEARRQEYQTAARQLLAQGDKASAKQMLSLSRRCDQLLEQVSAGVTVPLSAVPTRLNRPEALGASQSVQPAQPVQSSVAARPQARPVQQNQQSRALQEIQMPEEPLTGAAAQLQKIVAKWVPKLVKRRAEYQTALQQLRQANAPEAALAPILAALATIEDMVRRVEAGEDPGFHRLPEPPAPLAQLLKQAGGASAGGMSGGSRAATVSARGGSKPILAGSAAKTAIPASAGPMERLEAMLAQADSVAGGTHSQQAPAERIRADQRDPVREELEFDSLLEHLDNELRALKDLADAQGAGDVAQLSTVAKKTLLVIRRQQKEVTETRKLVATARERRLPPPVYHISEVKMPAIVQHLDVPELRMELKIQNLRDLSLEGIKTADINPYVTWSLDWPNNQGGQTPKAKLDPNSGAFVIDSLQKVKIEGRVKATQRKFKFLKLQFEIWHARVLWRDKLIAKGEFKLKDLLVLSDLSAQLKLKSAAGSGTLSFQIRQRSPIGGVEDLRQVSVDHVVVDRFREVVETPPSSSSASSSTPTTAPSATAAPNRPANRPQPPTSASPATPAAPAAPETPQFSAQDLQDPLRVPSIRSVNVLMAEQERVEQALAAGKGLPDEEREELEMHLMQLRAQHANLVMRVEKGMLVITDYLAALQADATRFTALAGILEAEQPPRSQEAKILRDWSRIVTEEWQEAQENLDELEDESGAADDDDAKADDSREDADADLGLEIADEPEVAPQKRPVNADDDADDGQDQEQDDEDLEAVPPLAGADPRDLRDPLRVAALVSVDVIMEEQAAAERQLQAGVRDEAQREQLQLTVLQLRAQHSTLATKVEKGILTLDDYLAGLRQAIASSTRLAEHFAAHARTPEHRRIVQALRRRATVMRQELETAEANMADLEQDEDLGADGGDFEV